MVSLRNYLKKKFPELNSSEIKLHIDSGACTINGRIEKIGSKEINLKKDRIVLRKLKKDFQVPKLSVKEERIIYEDEHLLVYDKEAHYPCTATANRKIPHLHGELRKFTKNNSLEAVHRLDKDTSGLIIFAKNQKVKNKLIEMFSKQEIHKEYEALVDGELKLKKDKTKIENELVLIDSSNNQQRWAVKQASSKSKGKPAITEVYIKKAKEDYSHVRLVPKTGRTHQLRVHMKSLGHPILGDKVYADSFKFKKAFARHVLHAMRLSFKHPITEETLELEAPYPKDFKKS